MYELVQAGPRTWYVECPAKVGIFQTKPGTVWLIDSGNDKDMARRLTKILNEKGWTLEGIVNTHSNADHIGGNAGLVKRTGCRVVGTGAENALTQYPWLEPSLLYGGYPFDALRNKFLQAEPSVPDATVENGLPEGLTAFPLPGHFLDMCGIRTADGVAFVADSVFPAATIEKYHLFFVYDVAAFLQTLDRLDEMQAALFVPSHAGAVADIRPLTALNRAKVLEICDTLADACKTPISAEDALKAVFDHYGLAMNMNQYVLVGSTVRSYLAYLCNTGRLESFFADNRLCFKTK